MDFSSQDQVLDLTLVLVHTCKMVMSVCQKGMDHGRLKFEELAEAPSQHFHAFTEGIFSIPWEVIHTEGICMICYFFEESTLTACW